MACSLLPLCVLAGCTATPVKEEFVRAPAAPEGRALVYFVRVPNFELQSSLTPSLTLNDLPLVNITNEGYTWLNLKSGRYTLKTIGTGLMRKDVAFDLDFDVTAGKTYIVQLELPAISHGPWRNKLMIFPVGAAVIPERDVEYARGWRVFTDDDVEWRLENMRTREYLRPSSMDFPPKAPN